MAGAQKFRILFVDDEQKVLDGLKRPLRSMRREWEMHFATSGRQGLDILAEREVDLVVSDMYMPGMDGAEFLRLVRKQYPQTIRTILSGHSDTSLILKTLKPAHKFLHKPCHPDTLVSWVNSILFFRRILPKQELQRHLNGIGALPSQPLFFALLFEAIAHANPQEVGEIIPYDVNMAANLLKVTLNAFFSQAQGLPTLSDAAKMIGMDLLYKIISSKDIFAEYNDIIFNNFSTDGLWRHCLRTAGYAALIGSQECSDPGFINSCYLAGLLHDLGKFLLINIYPDAYLKILEGFPGKNESLRKQEIATLGCCHGMAGAYLLGIWGVPLEIIEAVAFHEHPSAMKKYEISPLCIVHVANVFDHMFLRFTKNDPTRELDLAFLHKTISKEKLQSWQVVCKKSFNKTMDGLSMLAW